MIFVIIYTPLACLRKIQHLSIGYLIGNVTILFTTLLVFFYCIGGLARRGPQNDGFNPVNSSPWKMIGFSFYCFEGIGTLMPILRESVDPYSFPRILKMALIFLSVYFSGFAFVCFKYFGNQNEKFVINNI